MPITCGECFTCLESSTLCGVLHDSDGRQVLRPSWGRDDRPESVARDPAGRTATRALYAAVPHPYTEYPILGVDPREVVLRSYSVEGFLF